MGADIVTPTSLALLKLFLVMTVYREDEGEMDSEREKVLGVSRRSQNLHNLSILCLWRDPRGARTCCIIARSCRRTRLG